jgi:hypothetical protein
MEDNTLTDIECDERQRAIESLPLHGSNHLWIGEEFLSLGERLALKLR